MSSSSGRKRKKMVGDYVVGHKIGKGSFAAVWSARHKDTGKLAAIKSISNISLSKNDKHKENLESEIEIMRKLQHKNIVQLYDIVTTQNHIYLILEFCGGGDLYKFIHEHGKMHEHQAQRFLRQLATGLSFLHKHNMIHRDLKPQNLLLTNTDVNTSTLKIADFGFAKIMEPQDMAATLCGSPLYMAPEILQYSKYDAKADLWSVGTILFEMITGKQPFYGANPMELLKNIERKKRVTQGYGMSPTVEDLLLKLLKPDPHQRINFEEFYQHPFVFPMTNVPYSISPAVIQEEKEEEQPISPEDDFVMVSSTSNSQNRSTSTSFVRPSNVPDLYNNNYTSSVSGHSAVHSSSHNSRSSSSHSLGNSSIVGRVERAHTLPTDTSSSNKTSTKRSASQKSTRSRTLSGHNSRSSSEPGFNSDIDALDAFQSEGRRLHQIAFLGDAKIAAEEYCNGLALYIKALYHINMLIKTIKRYLSDSQMKTSNTSNALMSSQQRRIHDVLKFLIDRFVEYIKKANSLSSVVGLHGKAESTEKMMYEQALELARNAAIDETMASKETACKKYKEAYRFLMHLAYDKTSPVDQHDNLVLHRLMQLIFQRIQKVKESKGKG